MNRRFPSRKAFSLIELLTVISIISILSVAIAPSISSLVGAGGTTRAVTEASGLLEQARQSAMKLGTWVWVGVADTTALSDGSPQLTLVAVASRDGSSDLSATNLNPLFRTTRVPLARTVSASEAGAFILGSDRGSFPLKWNVPTASGVSEVDFSGMVIGFSPRGEAMVGPKQSPAWIKLSFASVTNPMDTAALLVAGPSGQVVVAR